MKGICSELKKHLLFEFKKKHRGGVYALTQRLLAYNSNKIEGSTLTEAQTVSLFETGTLTSNGEIIKSKDIEEMTGHFGMFNEMLQTLEEPLSHELIKKYHYRLKSGVFEDLLNGYPIGEYKSRKNTVSMIETTSPQEVNNAMTNLLNSYNNLEKIALKDVVKFHADYEKIHPFQDGNGRTGRAILYKECLRNNIMPLIIDDRNKAEYYKSLAIAQTEGDYIPLINLFEKEQKEYIEKVKDYLLTSEMKEEIGIDDLEEYER